MSSTIERSSFYQIKTIFPKENYKTAGGAMALHYLVALNQPEKTIQSWIDKHPEYLNSSDQKHFGLTPLSVCVIVNNKKLAQMFLSRGADPTIKDCEGWTAFHHATAVGDQEMLGILLEKVSATAVKKILNLAGGSYENLEKLIDPSPISLQERVCYYHEEGKEATECTKEKFQTLTGASFCRSIIVSPKEIIKKWKNQELRKSNTQTEKLLEEEYEKYLKNSPKLSLGKDSLEAPYGFDIFAEQDIKVSQVITVYGGMVDSELPITSETIYSMGDIHSKEIRNLGAMINDGFPNCYCQSVISQGFRHLLFIALRNIKKGEKILFNYGLTHTVKIHQLHPHFELNPEELERYVSTGSLIEKLEILSKVAANQADKEKLKYLLETPSALLYLLSKGALKCSDLEYLAPFFDFIYPKTSIFHDAETIARSNFFKLCSYIETRLQYLNSRGETELVKNFRALLFEWSQSFPISLIMNRVNFIRGSIQFNLNTMQNFEKFKKLINDYLYFMNDINNYCIGPEKPYTEEGFNGIKLKFENLTFNDQNIVLKDMLFIIENVNSKGNRKFVLQKIYEQLKYTKH